ncbi:MAG: hypothetical protein PWP49_1121 [Thermococcaceae archaeon]|jgi:uncharacterized protein with GYD domain|nr:hypothetical protein [Thermococcaceae archaeon]MDN5320701.1 hypothetical protein [Thermococcaceae archaeon]
MKDKKSRKIKALVFLSVTKDKLVDIGIEVAKIKYAKRVYEVLGNYDLVMFTEVSSREELGEVINTVSTLEGVKFISTFILTEKIK